MLDFMIISKRSTKRGILQIYPKFIIKQSSDLMIRGGDFYAIWIESEGRWSTEESDAIRLIDKELDIYAKENKNKLGEDVQVLHLWDAESGMIDAFHKYCQKQMRDNFHVLDETLQFANAKRNKNDYASKCLPYSLEQGSYNAYDKLIGTLYSPEEREKIEWAIGAIVSGDSKHIQKFMVLYGAAGTGKSTVLNIIGKLFSGYISVFDAKALGSSSNAFALEAFKSNPLVAIQHDGDLSRIEDNTRLNSLVSHEMMTVNEKFKSTYANRFNAFLFVGTNKPVKITDAKSGLIRRLIDVSPTGKTLSGAEYHTLMGQIDFELGAIAYHCLEVYRQNPERYDNYIPSNMLGATNDFYNFILDSYTVFKSENGITLKAAWEMYKSYCEDAKVPYPFSQRIFKEELKNYWSDFQERSVLEDGTRVRSYFTGFRTDIFDSENRHEMPKAVPDENWLTFDSEKSTLDDICANLPAQYASKKETPMRAWDEVKTKLSDLDTTRLHYVKLPESHIVIDFDIPDETGNKSLVCNKKAAEKFPPTYAELSKSGAGIHLHYIYSGDVTKLKRIYDEHIEVKVFTGKSSLRRKRTKCNRLPVSTIGSGLPLKEERHVVDFEGIKSEKILRTQIRNNLNRMYHANTKPSVDFINKILQDAYNSGMHYDVTDMRNAVLAFAADSTHHADYCIKLVNKMAWASADVSDSLNAVDTTLIFFDVEVFPNLFLVNWKKEGEEQPVTRLINPTPTEIESLMRFRLVGFNCRRYDNHILYARLLGYTNEQLYHLSQRIIGGERTAFFGEAYNVSYTDVYDFSSKKQSLKKFEIELGLHHQELGLPWDEPVPEERWEEVAVYCDNDVIATEAVFHARKSDFLARQILADVAGMTVNDTTNSLTTRIIFGKNRKPQDAFQYRNMGDVTQIDRHFVITPELMLYDDFGDEFTAFNKNGMPIFPGYKFENGKSTYRDEEVGEGGYVYAEPGMYNNVALLDIASMHPSSIVAEALFGEEYTGRFNDILQARIAIKHKDFAKAKKMLDGKLAKYLTDEETAGDLAQALKIAINSVYGLTSANFENPFRDIRNKDNIVAKRGALFMINLKHEVQKRGFTVAHIKTDSIKIPDATPDIIQFVTDYGKQYGYNFEHEATYDRMCLVNDAVYIAKYKDGKHAGEWTATGTQFQVPYVFKKLFSHAPIIFEDLCETKSVTSAIYLDWNEGLPDVSDAESRLKKGTDISEEEKAQLEETIQAGHSYRFIGKVGCFCPMKPGCGGGILLRETLNKKTGEKGFAAVTGTKGYRWMEAEMVRILEKSDDIDISYYNRMVDEAVATISTYGDFEWFVSDDFSEVQKE